MKQEKLSQLLDQAAKAHHQTFAAVNGEDPQWPDWYAQWILENTEPEVQFPKAVVGAVIYNATGEILLAESHKWPGRWVIPGGHVEWGERLEDALILEVKEETGLEVTSVRYLGHQEAIFSESFHKEKHMIFLDFACMTSANDIVTNDELDTVQWVNPQQSLKELKMGSFTRVAIERSMETSRLKKNFAFSNFKQALSFVNKIGELVDKMNHHPDVEIYDYKKVRVTSYSHDVGNVTDRDHKLMKRIEEISK